MSKCLDELLQDLGFGIHSIFVTRFIRCPITGLDSAIASKLDQAKQKQYAVNFRIYIVSGNTKLAALLFTGFIKQTSSVVGKAKKK